jgi:drug/metabolite transporter (DMT)-like permease
MAEHDYCRAPLTEEDEDGDSSGGSIYIGIFLSVVAGMLVAASMNVQQYALTSESLQDSRRYRVWLSGLALYCFAQMVCTGALSFSPLSLVAALFTTMLLWDLIIGRFLLHKSVTLPQFVGLGVIFVSVVVVAVVGPKEEYAITTDCLLYWTQAETGIIALSLLALVFVSNYIIYRLFVKEYPHFRAIDPESHMRVPEGIIPDSLNMAIQVVYPTILAVTETLGSLCLKAVSAMVLSAMSNKDDSQVLTVIFFVLAVVYIAAVWAIMVWLRVVYSKFATSECLAVEYGLVAVFSIVSSLLFFQVRSVCESSL